MLTFFANPSSRGRMVRWMLQEVGASYETVLSSWSEKPAALLAANPIGKVPTIVHDGVVVTETAAICAYLAEAFPDAGLAPRGDERASCYRWMLFTAGPLEAAMTNSHRASRSRPRRRAWSATATSPARSTRSSMR